LRQSRTLKTIKLPKSKKTCKFWDKKTESYSIICKRWKNSKNKNVSTKKDSKMHMHKKGPKSSRSKRKILKSKTKSNTCPKL
jgi:hypothetical protein